MTKAKRMGKRAAPHYEEDMETLDLSDFRPRDITVTAGKRKWTINTDFSPTLAIRMIRFAVRYTKALEDGVDEFDLAPLFANVAELLIIEPGEARALGFS